MAKRDSTESKIVQYFTYAPYGVAETILGICKGIVKSRAEENQPLPTGTAGQNRPKKARKARASKATGTQTSFPGAGVEAGNAA